MSVLVNIASTHPVPKPKWSRRSIDSPSIFMERGLSGVAGYACRRSVVRLYTHGPRQQQAANYNAVISASAMEILAGIELTKVEIG